MESLDINYYSTDFLLYRLLYRYEWLSRPP